MRPGWRIVALGLVLAAVEIVLSASAHAQGWATGNGMFGFAQYNPSTGWSSYYHPGDGRRGIYYVDAGGGNFFGDPRGRPLVYSPQAGGMVPPQGFSCRGRRPGGR